MLRTLIVCAFLVSNVTMAKADDELRQAMTFYASFDQSADADFAKGDRQIYTLDKFGGSKVVPGIQIEQAVWDSDDGRWGGSLDFRDNSESIVMFQGNQNMPYGDGFSATISFWMLLTPEIDLKPGYVDPIQVTDKKWNDASIFVDFSQENPRDFRLGCFSDYKHWNPNDTKWEELADSDRPLVTVKKPGFSRERWVHVVIVLEDMNREPSYARLYLDGRLQGTHLGPHQISWDPEQVRIMLGIKYIGRLDDLAIFDRALTLKQIRQLAEFKGGLRDLLKHQ